MFSFLSSTKKMQIWSMHILHACLWEKCDIDNLVSNVLINSPQLLLFYHLREMFVSAYLNVRVLASFNVFYPSPKCSAMFFPSYPSEHCQFRSQPFVPTEKMLATHPRKTNCFMWYDILLPPRWLHCHILGMPEGFPEENKSHCDLIQPTILAFKGTKWNMTNHWKEWKIKRPSSKIN